MKTVKMHWSKLRPLSVCLVSEPDMSSVVWNENHSLNSAGLDVQQLFGNMLGSCRELNVWKNLCFIFKEFRDL